MASKYWIKLYHEILHDRKMATLSPELWQRTIQMFLVAGEQDEDGGLPPIEDIAWTLRLNVEQLETEMIELQRLGILSVTDNIWVVTHFKERQAPSNNSERGKQLRERKHKQQYANNERNVRDTFVDKIRIDTDKESDTDSYTDSGDGQGGDGSFEKMRDMLERLVGLPVTPRDIQEIDQLKGMSISEDDIRGALQWRKDNNRPPVKTIGALIQGIRTNYSMRVQGDNARPNESNNGKKSGKYGKTMAPWEIQQAQIRAAFGEIKEDGI